MWWWKKQRAKSCRTNAVESSAKARADAEIGGIDVERDAEKDAQNAKVVSEQAVVANQDAARRVCN